MRKESLFAGLLALLLMFVFLGCEQANSGTKPGSGLGTGADPNDKWTEVTSLDGLEGTWKSSVTVPNEDGKDSTTVVVTITYPASGKGVTETGGEVEIKNGVKFEIFIDGQSQNAVVTSKEEFESMLKTGIDSSPVGTVTGYLFVNGSKTRLKLEGSQEIDGMIDSDWKYYQEEIKKSMPTGDMTITFSAGAPYTITTTLILHKQ